MYPRVPPSDSPVGEPRRDDRRAPPPPPPRSARSAGRWSCPTRPRPSACTSASPAASGTRSTAARTRLRLPAPASPPPPPYAPPTLPVAEVGVNHLQAPRRGKAPACVIRLRLPSPWTSSAEANVTVPAAGRSSSASLLASTLASVTAPNRRRSLEQQGRDVRGSRERSRRFGAYPGARRSWPGPMRVALGPLDASSSSFVFLVAIAILSGCSASR